MIYAINIVVWWCRQNLCVTTLPESSYFTQIHYFPTRIAIRFYHIKERATLVLDYSAPLHKEQLSQM